jgi:hypothetical protein
VFLLAPIATMFALQDRGINAAVFGYGMAACAAYAVYAALLVIASADIRPVAPKAG